MPMRALFWGGPADGGELVLAEPIRTRLRFPMTQLEVIDTFDPLPLRHGRALLVPIHVPSEYVLEYAGDRPWRDSAGRIRYRYVHPQPHPKENPDD